MTDTKTPSPSDAETVDLIGVRDDGTHVNLGKISMPPRMKAREIARSYFGPFEDDDASDAEMCFGALETFLDWLVKQGWADTTPPPQAVREPLNPDQVTAAAKKLAECMDYPWEYMNHDGRVAMHKHAKAVIEAAHGIIKGGQHGPA